jgi:transposase-like protein
MSKKTYNKEQKQAILDSIFEDISKGISLRKACKNIGIPRITFFDWIDKDQSKADLYTRARQQGIEARFESIEDVVV